MCRRGFRKPEVNPFSMFLKSGRFPVSTFPYKVVIKIECICKRVLADPECFDFRGGHSIRLKRKVNTFIILPFYCADVAASAIYLDFHYVLQASGACTC